MLLLLQILAVYVAVSTSVGLLIAARLGKLICRGDRRLEQEIALLARSRAVQRVGLQRVESSPGLPAGLSQPPDHGSLRANADLR